MFLTYKSCVSGAVEAQLALQFHPRFDFADECGLAHGRRSDAGRRRADLSWLLPAGHKTDVRTNVIIKSDRYSQLTVVQGTDSSCFRVKVWVQVGEDQRTD